MAVYFIAAFVLSLFLTLGVRAVASALEIVDVPDGERKLHAVQMPLLGGVAIYAAFWLVVLYLSRYTTLLAPHINTRQLLSMFVATSIIVLMGVMDDRYSLSPWVRIVCTSLSAVVALIGGIGLHEVTNPWGGVWNLHIFNTILFGHSISVVAAFIGSYSVYIVDFFYYSNNRFFLTSFRAGKDEKLSHEYCHVEYVSIL
jgi:UDP-GlcNAc:undecaprenyl-phosphate GlcNAc-1-phosphate transferase